MLKNSGYEVTFRMQTLRGDGDFAHASDYTFDVDHSATRYTSVRSGMVVEVNGRSVTIQNTAEKQSRGTTKKCRQ
ncbi:hypothetical protein AAVH_34178 [Aphelenchoides avenae]|nr:hypothetical protein AAVH_34178 [Aphelenchus avenae]